MSLPDESIGYRESGYFSRLVTDYLDEKPNLRDLYHRFPTLDNFGEQIEEKADSFSQESRKRLVEALTIQYNGLATNRAVTANIASLLNPDAFTITTGHQLSLFTGPLYFVYKIMSAIRLTQELTKKYPAKKFVPVYWMATEDHDFEEISHFNFHGRKFRWNHESGGATGRLSLEGLESVIELFSQEAGDGANADKLRNVFREAYLAGGNLADATRRLVNSLFGKYGLVIIDGDDPVLKKGFVPVLKKELFARFSHATVSKTIENMKGYDIQVNPREINLFYLGSGLRERIVYKDQTFRVLQSDIRLTEDEMALLIETEPERLSPNVILRPLYQEIILPNLCYIGGGGEIAYWLELKAMFDEAEIPFPILLLRNSVLVVTEKQKKQAHKLGLSVSDLFLPDDALRNLAVTKASALPIDLTFLRETLRKQFDLLKSIADKTDKSFTGAVLAQEKKQLNGLDTLEKRLLRAERRKHHEIADRAVMLRADLFPMGGLQERSANLADFYETHGNDFLTVLETLDPLSPTFSILQVE